MSLLRRRALSRELARHGDTADDSREFLCRGATSRCVEVTTVIRQLARESVDHVGAAVEKRPRPIRTRRLNLREVEHRLAGILRAEHCIEPVPLYIRFPRRRFTEQTFREEAR